MEWSNLVDLRGSSCRLRPLDRRCLGTDARVSLARTAIEMMNVLNGLMVRSSQLSCWVLEKHKAL
jgi:hypothetical protein